jgi:hypothetical protein
MKKIFVLIALIAAFTGSMYAGDVDTLIAKGNTFKDTMTATKDTMDIGLRNDEYGLNLFQISAFATTGADTIDVYTLSPNGLTWVKVGLTDLASGSVVTQIITSTTAKTYVPLDEYPIRVRLVCTDAGSASSVVIYGGKKIGE